MKALIVVSIYFALFSTGIFALFPDCTLRVPF